MRLTRRTFIQASAATSGLLAAGCATQPPVSAAMAPRKLKGGAPAKGDWVASTCQGCTQWCAIQVFVEDGRVRLRARAYLPARDDGMKIHILGTDVSSLITTIDHNLQANHTPFFQRKVRYDNLPEEILPRFREMSAESAQGLLEKFDRWLSRHDRDANPSVKGTGRRTAGLGIYYFEEPTDQKD